MQKIHVLQGPAAFQWVYDISVWLKQKGYKVDVMPSDDGYTITATK